MSILFGKTEEDGMNGLMDGKIHRSVDCAATERDEHYDGGRVEDVFEGYECVRRGTAYVPVRFVETRKYLQQVRDQKRAIELLEKRIGYRKDAGMDTDEQEAELAEAADQLKQIIADVADEVSKVGDVNQETVLTKRYIDIMSWDEVAETADLKMRTVHKCHGKALPKMEEILLADGLITLEEGDGEDEYSS